ncbi:MAG TPA: multicopper oxidase domain-containing protein [Deferrisomatales bacterium]|nr:multicopper oxidase domain-containing protein [Deferrisomatales bacterium]
MPAGTPSTASTNAYAFSPAEGHGYVWHCHIIDHEDNEMMRPWNVAANPAAPAAAARAIVHGTHY